MGQPLDLNFQVFETVVVFVTVIMTGFVNMEGAFVPGRRAPLRNGRE
jgi:Ca2+/H+ antiporter